MTTQSYPDDLDARHALIETQQTVIDQLQAELAQIQGTSGQQADTIQSLQQRIEKLQHELQLFKRHLFGQRRERYLDDPRQGKLFEIDGTETTQQPESSSAESSDGTPEKSSRRGHGRRRLPDSFRVAASFRRQRRRALLSLLRQTASPGQRRNQRTMGVSARDVSRRAARARHLRVPEQGCSPNMATAPKPPQPIEKGLAGPGMLAFVVTSQLAEHLPLNRLEDVTCRYGMHIARSTLCDWMAASRSGPAAVPVDDRGDSTVEGAGDG